MFFSLGTVSHVPLSLGQLAEGVGNSSDVTVSFKRPSKPGVVGVAVLSGAMTIFIDFPQDGVAGVDGVAKVQVLPYSNGLIKGPPPLIKRPPLL